MSEHNERLVKFEANHVDETIGKMAAQLRRHADSLDRIAKRQDGRLEWKVNEAWGEIRTLNANLRFDVLVSSMGRTIELTLPAQGDNK